ncbi:MAG TPA: hypothetical protein VG052_15125, partial [Puia sp.]|nr:hypothetical protein [Puia sp.]
MNKALLRQGFSFPFYTENQLFTILIDCYNSFSQLGEWKISIQSGNLNLVANLLIIKAKQP